VLVTSGLVWFVRAYQHLVSPIFPPCCRYTPSCSEYAIQALRKHGVVRGLVLAAARLCRCNPWAEGGEDLVP
jgi:putative membrane protein insertion efficiency factor